LPFAVALLRAAIAIPYRSLLSRVILPRRLFVEYT
jgi:hypothetical protein